MTTELPTSYVAWAWNPLSKTWREVGAATTAWECADVAAKLAESGPRVVRVLPAGQRPDEKGGAA